MSSVFSKKPVQHGIHHTIDFSIWVGSLFQAAILFTELIVLVALWSGNFILFSQRLDRISGEQYDLLCEANFLIPGNLFSMAFLVCMIMASMLVITFFGFGILIFEDSRLTFWGKVRNFFFPFRFYQVYCREGFVQRLDRLLPHLPNKKTWCIYIPIGMVLSVGLFFCPAKTSLPGYFYFKFLFFVWLPFVVDFCITCWVKKKPMLSKSSDNLFLLLLSSHVFVGGTLLASMIVVYAFLVFPWSGQVILYGIWGCLCVAQFWLLCLSFMFAFRVLLVRPRNSVVGKKK